MALINDAHRWVFIHIPKNAGTSIRRALEGVRGCRRDLQESTHETAAQVLERLPQAKGFRFWAVLRNPYSRAESMYRYLRGQGIWEEGDFRDFCDSLTVRRHWLHTLNVTKPQAYFLAGAPVTTTFAYEDLERLWPAMSEDFARMPTELGKANTSPAAPTPWTQFETDCISHVYEDDFALGGYRKLPMAVGST